MTILLLAALASLAATPAAAAPGLAGSWTNPARSIIVKIGPCGGTLCGRVVSASAKARADAADAGTSPLVGVELISAIEPTGPGRWRADIFVPDQNGGFHRRHRAGGPKPDVGPRLRHRRADLQGAELGASGRAEAAPALAGRGVKDFWALHAKSQEAVAKVLG